MVMIVLSLFYIELLLSAGETYWPVRSCGRRVKKNVESCDLFISDDDHVLTRISRHAAARPGAPL
jgi:hypothetical protein